MTRALAVAVLAASLAACSSGASTVGSRSSSTLGGSATTATTHRIIAVAGPTSSIPALEVPISPPSRSPAPSPPSTAAPALGGPGSGAARFLQPSGSTSIVVQVLTQSGAEPRQPSLDHLQSVLQQAAGKSVAFSGGTVTSSTTKWDDASLEAVTSSRRPYLPAGATLIQYVFVHGTYRGDTNVLGISVTGDLTAIFSDQVTAAATGLATPARIEESVTTHELGHLLGLVDLYLHTGRADAQHPGHSTNPHSVMYWAVESSVVGDLLTGGPPVDFDDADRADLATIRGR